MSKRSDRREAERVQRKLAYQQLRKQPSAAAQIMQTVAEAAKPDPDLLAKAQAFFERPEVASNSVSEAQLQANRTNARLSRGPSSAEGKAISSRNNTRHGLAVDSDVEAENFRVLPTENQAAYDRSLVDFRAEWKPVTATERELVDRMVTHRWLRRRAVHLQEALFDAATGAVSDLKKFDLYRRYETSHERGFNKAFADLQRLRAFQLRQQNGFESQQRKNEEHQFKIRRLVRQEEAQLEKLSDVATRPDYSKSINAVQKPAALSAAALVEA